MTRRTSRFGLTILLTAGAVAGGQILTASGQDDPRTDVELSFTNWTWVDGGPHKAFYEPFNAEFVANHPQMGSIKVEVQPFPQYHDVLNIRLAANDPPSMGWIGGSFPQQYVPSGRLVDLKPFIDAIPDYDLADFPEPYLARWSVGDAIYGLPLVNAGNVLYFNKDIFAAAGIKTPLEMLEEGTWTWDAVRTAAQQAKATGGAQFGLHFIADAFSVGPPILQDLMAPYGGSVWGPDTSTCALSSPGSVASLQLFWDMIYTDGTHPGPGVATDFGAGNVAMAFGRPNAAPRFADAPFEWDVVPPPTGPEGFVPVLSQAGGVAFADAEDSDLAAQWVVEHMSPANAVKASAIAPSPRRSLANLETLSGVMTYFTEEQIDRSVIPTLTTDAAQIEWDHKNWAAIDRALKLAFDGLLYKPDADVPAVLATICTGITPLLQ